MQHHPTSFLILFIRAFYYYFVSIFYVLLPQTCMCLQQTPSLPLSPLPSSLSLPLYRLYLSPFPLSSSIYLYLILPPSLVPFLSLSFRTTKVNLSPSSIFKIGSLEFLWSTLFLLLYRLIFTVKIYGNLVPEKKIMLQEYTVVGARGIGWCRGSSSVVNYK